VNGVIYTARDSAHKRLMELLKNARNCRWTFGGRFCTMLAQPGPARPGDRAAGPTTSTRMDVYTPHAEAWVEGHDRKGEGP